MTSKRYTKEVISDIESDLTWCWKILSDIKSNNIGKSTADDIIKFQNKLINATFKLDKAYRKLVGEKLRLIKNKKKYNYIWVSRKMGIIDFYMKCIKSAIGISKIIGDGFVWYFYRFEPELLERHLKYQRQMLLPPGIGGIGERAFMEKCQGIGSFFVLYHGISSFLRMGDVSFIDLKRGKLAAIGEIKTEKIEENQYDITIGFVFRDEEYTSQTEKAIGRRPHKIYTENAHFGKKLKNQIIDISSSFTDIKKRLYDTTINLKRKGYFDELEYIVTGSLKNYLTTKQAGPGMILASFKHTKSTRLSEVILYNHGIENFKIDEIKKEVLKIMKPESKENCIFLSTLGFDKDGFPMMNVGTIPIAWWPINSDALHKIIFGYVTVIVIYNPAHFWDHLRRDGFDVKVSEKSRFLYARRRINHKIAEFRNLDYFSYLEQNFLIRIDDITESFKDMALSTLESMPSGKMTVDMIPRIRIILNQ